MNLSEAVTALTQQYMREKDWPERRARRKALAVVRRKAGAVRWNEKTLRAAAIRVRLRSVMDRALGALPYIGAAIVGAAITAVLFVLWT